MLPMPITLESEGSLQSVALGAVRHVVLLATSMLYGTVDCPSNLSPRTERSLSTPQATNRSCHLPRIGLDLWTHWAYRQHRKMHSFPRRMGMPIDGPFAMTLGPIRLPSGILLYISGLACQGLNVLIFHHIQYLHGEQPILATVQPPPKPSARTVSLTQPGVIPTPYSKATLKAATSNQTRGSKMNSASRPYITQALRKLRP